MAEIDLKTNIPKLDEFLGGGLKKYTVTSFTAKPGLDIAPFAYQITKEALKRKQKVLYVTTAKKPETILSEIEFYGWDLKKDKENGTLTFIDSYSGLMKMPSDYKYAVSNPREPDNILETVKKAASDIKEHKLIILDSLSTIIDTATGDVMKTLLDWKKELKKMNATLIVLFTEWDYKEELLKNASEIPNAIVKIKAIEDRVMLRTFYSLTKIDWGEKPGKDIPFKIVRPGGVEIYIPKILVTGAYNAGKTSFLHSASTKAVSVDRFGTTIALDHGHLDYKGFSVDLFGTPGQQRFDPILSLLGGQALGVIIILDSTDPQSFPRAKEMWRKTKNTRTTNNIRSE